MVVDKVVNKVLCFDTVYVRTLQRLHLRRAFHDTSTQRHAKRRSLFLPNRKEINWAKVEPRPPPPANSVLREIIEPLNDDSQFEYANLSYMVKTLFALFV